MYRATMRLMLLFSTVTGLVDAVGYSYRWASTGGGLKAMTANMGLANLLQQADLLNDESTSFDAISTSSGATWFSTQLFYSPIFFNRTVMSTPQELYDFVLEWLNAYASVIPIQNQNNQCSYLESSIDGSILDDFQSACTTLTEYNGSWALFISTMLNATSLAYGDTEFVNRPVDVPNKIWALLDTALLIQTSLAPYSRNRSSNTAIYIGPADASEAYTVPLSTQYMVTTYERLFVTATDGALSTSNGSVSMNFSIDAFQDFNLYPGSNGTLVTATASLNAQHNGEFQRPFNGMAPTTAQICSASSAGFGVLSGIVPSLLAQALSFQQHEVATANHSKAIQRSMLSALRKSGQALYQNSMFDGLAVCSQYPQPCGDSDGIFVDGSYTDGPTLALSIGEYQSLEQGDPDAIIKILLLSTNALDTATGLHPYLAYFNSSFNKNVEPGDFMWTETKTPWRSPQVFNEYLDHDGLVDQLSPIQGTNFSTLIVSGTTIDNPAFGVNAGQRVEVFMILVNTTIPEVIMGIERLETYNVPLAELANGISLSQELLSRVQQFFPRLTDAPSQAPTPLPTRNVPSGATKAFQGILLPLVLMIGPATYLFSVW